MNSIGRVFYDLLVSEVRKRRLKTVVVQFNTTNDTKRDAIEHLQLLISQNQIQLLDEPFLKLQFAAYEIQRTPTGKITYNNSSDKIHDDIVMSSAIALSNHNKGNYMLF